MNLRHWGVLLLGALWAIAAGAGGATFYINIGTDQPDADLNDGICDSDLGAGGEQCTFRAAIQEANIQAGPDNIFFDLPTGITPTLPVMSYLSPLPNITDTVVIDASTQPVFARVELNGLFTGAAAKGLVIESTDCVVRNLTINRYLGSGIVLRRGGGHTIQGCYLGLNSGGATARPNGVDGLQIESSSDNIIGGLLPGEGNVISGNNRHGIYIAQSSPQFDVPNNNTIVGNLIGVTANGTGKLANAVHGIMIENASNTHIGAPGAAGRNVISGNNGSGVFVSGEAAKATGTAILGNLVGVDISGESPLGNAQSGILIEDAGLTFVGDATSSPGLPPGNVIAGNTTGITLRDVVGQVRIKGNSIGAGQGGAPLMPNSQDGIRAMGSSRLVEIGGALGSTSNLIAHNGRHGVAVAPQARQVAILRNAIFNNDSLGIDLGEDGPTANDDDDSDTGANDLQNYPLLLIAGVRAEQLRVDGALVSHPDQTYRVEFFANTECDPVGFGEGETYLGFANVRTNADGETVFSAYLPQPASPDHRITATATSSEGSTSEFSACEDIVDIELEGLTVY